MMPMGRMDPQVMAALMAKLGLAPGGAAGPEGGMMPPGAGGAELPPELAAMMGGGGGGGSPMMPGMSPALRAAGARRKTLKSKGERKGGKPEPKKKPRKEG